MFQFLLPFVLLQFINLRLTESDLLKPFTLCSNEEELFQGRTYCLSTIPNYFTRSFNFIFMEKATLYAQILKSYSHSQCVIKIFQEYPKGVRRYIKINTRIINGFGQQANDPRKMLSELVFTSTNDEMDAANFLVEHLSNNKDQFDQTQRALIGAVLDPDQNHIYYFAIQPPVLNGTLNFKENTFSEKDKKSTDEKDIKYILSDMAPFVPKIVTALYPTSRGEKPEVAGTFTLSGNLCPKLTRYMLDNPGDQEYCTQHYEEDISGAILKSNLRVPEGNDFKSWYCGSYEIVYRRTKAGAFVN